MVARKEWELFETRLISGRGLFLIPPNDNLRHLYLYLNVVREPSTNFTNSKYNPDKSEYAKITWIRENYVLREDAMNFEHQRFEWACDPSAAGFYAQFLACAFTDLTNRLDYGFGYLGVPPLMPGDRAYVEPLKDAPTDIKIVCRGNTAIEAQLWKLDYDYACPEGQPTPKPPPDPPQPPPVPPDTPIGDISPPYDPPSDGGDTDPAPGDDNPPPPPPVPACWKTYTTYSPYLPPTTDHTFGLSTDVPELWLPPGAGAWQLRDSVTGRAMRDNWVGASYNPTMTVIGWQPVCETTEIYGYPP
jgi:hypothetical protein